MATVGVRYLGSRPNLDVRDLDRAVAFYTGVLGLTLRRRVEEFGLVLLGEEGGCELALTRADAVAPHSCYLLIAGVEALHARCLEARAPLDSPLTSQPWGLRDFVVLDPDGNRIAIGERIAAE